MLFCQDLADTVLQRLSDGMSLRKACDATGMPAPSTVLDWASGKHIAASAALFPEQYAAARARGYMLMADEIIDISDDGSNDTRMVGDGDNERAVADSEWISRSKLRVDSRKWLLSKMLPKVFGDKLDLTHSGEIGLKRIERVIKHPEIA